MKAQTKILVVDDEPLMRRMLGHTLTRLGFSVIECADGVEAFHVLESLKGDALLVLDYAMPKFNGAQVCEIIRTHSDPGIAQTPIIMLTGHVGEQHEIECLQAGADDFVSKPVNLTVLKVRIETHLRVASLRGQLQQQNRQLELWRSEHERDLEASRLIQQAIIPQRLPELEGWEFAARHDSLIQVGGDIYDWLRLPDGGLLLWIADATGHGVSAALLTTFIKLLFRYAVAEESEPASVLECVNRNFHSIFKGHSFLTAACAVLRPGERTVRVAGAGHPPLLIVRRDGRIKPLPSTAPPIGLLGHGKLEELSARLAPGDTLLLFTDGLYGVKNPKGERLSFSRLLKMLRGQPCASAAAVLEMAMAQPLAFAEKGGFDDDVALVAARMRD